MPAPVQRTTALADAAAAAIELARAARASNTTRAYDADWRRFETWCRERRLQPMPADPTPFDGPTLAVTGSNLPKFAAKVTPSIVPFGSGFTITWAVTNSATGKPYGTRIRVVLGVDNQCIGDIGASPAITSTAGFVTHTYPASDGDAGKCLQIPNPPDFIDGLGVQQVGRPGIVSAVPSKSSAPVGTVVPVNGNVLGAPISCPVLLQRLYGATQWRGVSTGVVRQSGRFTLTAQPAYKGLIPYRVYFAACRNFQKGISKVFSIRGL